MKYFEEISESRKIVQALRALTVIKVLRNLALF